MKNLLRQFIEDETGATAVEYGLIVAVLSLAIVAGIGRAMDALQFLFSDNNSRLVQIFANH
ncbi:Flp family type IVb pilin [Mesorhizobium sp. CU2]|uniref:Flp family type IVb pilin n=1 Tax=unclassified Mesorhizobium TaxID=325217 RepID=UPI0011271818|nr:MULTISPECIES: Flp family type IVb pilin [unclassified Mesorhizobium]TPN75023.1 Flp family type IVb pilin [Mesorhizobium sp. CU3]TPO14653.1 Flp family type IVb pilin [Mesorhizobium sp. CU2]